MLLVLKLFIFGLVLAHTTDAVRPFPPHAAIPTEQGLARLFFSSRTTQYDLKTSVACFTSYIAESSLIGRQYGGKYNNCYAISKAARKDIEQKFLQKRTSILQTTQNICQSMQNCNSLKDDLDLFNCHVKIGSNSTKMSYSLSGNASEFAVALEEQYGHIGLNYDKCCREAERTYVNDVANNYSYLHDCLDGRVPPRPIPDTTTSTSTTTTTTTTTTEAPTTTTTEPPITTEPITPNTEDPKAIKEQFAQLLNLLN